MAAVAVDMKGVKINLDILEIGKFIEGLIEKYGRSAGRREAFVKDLLETLKFDLSKKNTDLNIMIFNLQQPSDINLKEVVFYKATEFDGMKYGVWLFKSGTLENLGKGTYQNWGMYGRFKRSGPKVTGGLMGRFVDFN